jgi:cytochrome P450 family 619
MNPDRLDQWAKEYGPIYSLKIAHQTSIVITDRRLVKELMDKRSSITSNRPKAHIADQMVYGGDDIIFMQSNNPHWKVARRFMHQNFMGSMVDKQHMPLLNAEAVQMIRDMITMPEDFMKHPKRFANSFMMSVG